MLFKPVGITYNEFIALMHKEVANIIENVQSARNLDRKHFLCN